MINTLYSLLVDHPLCPQVDQFSKMTTPVFHTKKSRAIQDILLAGVLNIGATSRMPLFASVVCYLVRFSDFGDDIYKLDPVNTYVEVERAENETNADMCIHDLTTDTGVSSTLTRYLDQDIKDRLQCPTWLDYMAAGCLQMLREVTT